LFYKPFDTSPSAVEIWQGSFFAFAVPDYSYICGTATRQLQQHPQNNVLQFSFFYFFNQCKAKPNELVASLNY
jgi:hypothetical protein